MAQRIPSVPTLRSAERLAINASAAKPEAVVSIFGVYGGWAVVVGETLPGSRKRPFRRYRGGVESDA